VFYQVTKDIAKIVHIDVTNVGDDRYGQVSSASLKLQSRWRSINPWDQEHWGFPSRSSSENIRVYFDLDVTRGQYGLGQDIICLQIAKAIKFGQGNSLPSILYALLLEPTNHGKLMNEYQRIGLAVIPTHGKI
jgi:hypothetical protein